MSETQGQKSTYLLEEMRVARERIAAEIDRINQFEVLSFTAIGAIYLLFFQYKIVDHGAIVLLAFLAVAICAYGIVRYRAHAAVIQTHECYIKEVIENKVFGPERGLVEYYDNHKKSRLRQARFLFWGVMLLVSLVILILATFWPDYITRALPKS
jgi:hypothetical protein